MTLRTPLAGVRGCTKMLQEALLQIERLKHWRLSIALMSSEVS